MATPINNLLSALAAAPGETVLAKMDYLIAGGDIFTASPDGMRMVAMGFDAKISMYYGHVTAADQDLQAAHLAGRLASAGVRVPKAKLRNELDHWPEHLIAETERLYRMTRASRISTANAKSLLRRKSR